MVHVCKETVSTFILIVQLHISVLGLLEGKVVKQVSGLNLCQEQAKDQGLTSAGTELKIKFVILTSLVENPTRIGSYTGSWQDPSTIT